MVKLVNLNAYKAVSVNGEIIPYQTIEGLSIHDGFLEVEVIADKGLIDYKGDEYLYSIKHQIKPIKFYQRDGEPRKALLTLEYRKP